MIIEQKQFTLQSGWKDLDKQSISPDQYQLVLAFGKDSLIKNPQTYSDLRQFYPKADIVLASDSGQILNVSVTEETVVSTAIYFEKTSIKAVSQSVEKETSYDVGKALGQQIVSDTLKHVLIISEGLNINGSKLIQGIHESVGKDVTLSGGLAADNMHFVKTYVGLNQSPSEVSQVVVIGFYGEALQIGLGSIGGWDTFGPKRLITKSVGNTVYEIDGQPALDLYKKYLGEFAKDLPGSGLLFPLSIQAQDADIVLVRTLLSIDENEKSVTYAGDVPEGSIAWLMKANFERVIDGAGQAVKNGLETVQNPEFALLISCAGRKAILKQRVEEEIENIRFILGSSVKMSGFYSFGEIAPMGDIKSCYLHNQTMTVSLFREI